MYAIVNIRTNKYVYGTDRRYCPPHQRTSNRKMLTYEYLYEAISDFNCRKCGKDYRIVVLKTIEIERVIEPIDEKYIVNPKDKRMWE